jgi:hypothetical protein
MRRRLGDHPQPLTVLTGKHMRWIEQFYRSLYFNAKTRKDHKNITRAGITHLSSYLGWLRSMETFGLHWGRVISTKPAEGPSLGLPPGCGVIVLKLLQQTKSSQFAQVDVVIAYTTASGLSLGWWIERLCDELSPVELAPAALMLAHPNGAAWTSHY